MANPNHDHGSHGDDHGHGHGHGSNEVGPIIQENSKLDWMLTWVMAPLGMAGWVIVATCMMMSWQVAGSGIEEHGHEGSAEPAAHEAPAH